LNINQVDEIIKKARERVLEWDKTGAGTKFAPPPPPPPPQGDFDQPQQVYQENEEERNKAERQERLGMLLTKEVH